MMERRDAYLKDSKSIAKQGEKPAQNHLYGSSFSKMEQMYVAFPLQKSNWKVCLCFNSFW